MTRRARTPTELTARHMGQNAYKNNLPRDPFQDPKLTTFRTELKSLRGEPGSTANLVDQWLIGWDIENVNAPLPPETKEAIANDYQETTVPLMELTCYEKAYEYGRKAFKYGLVRNPKQDGWFMEWVHTQPEAIHILLQGEWFKGWDFENTERIDREESNPIVTKPKTWTLTISDPGQPLQKMGYGTQDGAIIGAITYLNRQFAALQNDKEINQARLSADFSHALTDIVQWTNPHTSFNSVLYVIE